MSKRPTTTFAIQRASAVVMIPLAIWFLWSLAAHAGNDFAGTQAWLSQPHNKFLFGLLVTIGVFHGRIGIHEVIEDYIHDGLNGVLNWLAILSALAIAGLTWWSLLTL